MNPRQRLVETLTFGTPDRVPFNPGNARESTLAAWHTQGLPDGVDYRRYLLELLGIEPPPNGTQDSPKVDTSMHPRFEEKILEHKGGHYICQDWKGNICEISDQFDLTYLRTAKDFVTRRWIRCPVGNREDWEHMKNRYDPDSPGRFPEDFAERASKAAGRDWPVTVAVNGPFWQMREWCGFEGLCELMIDDPELVADMASFWTEFIAEMIERMLKHMAPDVFRISEDMAYKAKAMISPTMTREFIKPSYERWVGILAKGGVPIIDIDSDGYVAELIPIWIESGINVCDPVEVAAHNDINEYRRIFGHRMAYRGGVDKREMAKGGESILRELARIEPVVRDGGYIPSCDHGVPADVSWPAFVEYAEGLARITGWK